MTGGVVDCPLNALISSGFTVCSIIFLALHLLTHNDCVGCQPVSHRFSTQRLGGLGWNVGSAICSCQWHAAVQTRAEFNDTVIVATLLCAEIDERELLSVQRVSRIGDAMFPFNTTCLAVSGVVS
jgi:hypothetical protein